MSTWQRLFVTTRLTRDVANPDYHAVEVAVTNLCASLLGQSIKFDIEALIPGYNEKDYYGSNDRIVASHFVKLNWGSIGHLDRLALMKDAEKRGVVSLRIVPRGVRISKKDIDWIFDTLASAKGGWGAHPG
jgi:hypothetical protein